jgi:DNA-binding CsgD family transcriptional regulator
MRVAAVLTSHVMDAIAHLPGVPTLDWCDRAAAAITRVHHPSVACVTLGRIDARGLIATRELVGAAASDPASCVSVDPVTGHAVIGPRGSVAAPASPNDLDYLRSNIRIGDALGWSLGPLSEGLWSTATATSQHLLSTRGQGPLFRRWEWLAPSEVLLAGVSIPARSPGRLLLIELAIPGKGPLDVTREEAVLAAALPMLRHRLANAFGLEEGDEHRWLTPREELVLWRLVEGMKVPAIAAELHRSVYTVHDHVKSLHRKLNASNRGQLVSRALGHLGPLAGQHTGLGARPEDPRPDSPPQSRP